MNAINEHQSSAIVYREPNANDFEALLNIEEACFENDRLSRRQMRHWINSNHRIMIVAEKPETDSNGLIKGNGNTASILGYGLVIMRKGTSLARLYSLAVLPSARGFGIAKTLLQKLEEASLTQQKLFLRLEVSTQNKQAINLYTAAGYRAFGYYPGYYEDHTDAIRMQKAICQVASKKRLQAYPYYEQTTAFTCGPSALMMAMAKLGTTTEAALETTKEIGMGELDQSEELAIWRQATTIFMTSGHGGTHPLGLALAAIDRGFKAEVYLNQPIPLFLAGVRHSQKKQVLQKVEEDYLKQAIKAKAVLHYKDFTREDIAQALRAGKTILCLISSYQFDGYKGPHWVTVTHIDNAYLYIHDPEPLDEPEHAADSTTNYNLLSSPTDRQHVPVSLDNFERYTAYGGAKLRTAVFLSKA